MSSLRPYKNKEELINIFHIFKRNLSYSFLLNDKYFLDYSTHRFEWVVFWSKRIILRSITSRGSNSYTFSSSVVFIITSKRTSWSDQYSLSWVSFCSKWQLWKVDNSRGSHDFFVPTIDESVACLTIIRFKKDSTWPLALGKSVEGVNPHIAVFGCSSNVQSSSDCIQEVSWF